jgi:hypothetical protein
MTERAAQSLVLGNPMKDHIGKAGNFENATERSGAGTRAAIEGQQQARVTPERLRGCSCLLAIVDLTVRVGMSLRVLAAMHIHHRPTPQYSLTSSYCEFM